MYQEKHCQNQGLSLLVDFQIFMKQTRYFCWWRKIYSLCYCMKRKSGKTLEVSSLVGLSTWYQKKFFCILLTYILSSILPKCTKSVLFSLLRITPVSSCFPILWLYTCIIFHGKIKCVCFSSPLCLWFPWVYEELAHISTHKIWFKKWNWNSIPQSLLHKGFPSIRTLSTEFCTYASLLTKSPFR